ncbi:hypothetical protein [Selenomonas sp. oral taxon 892]|uniref:hypothetical protein n=1 Tax=Selenomonas sp. oral taxon 892 TaxID=1321785 RepID=UPI0003F50620|nr:hypothetical protein [Selenomonas sp. oral taxon 892]
MRGTLSHEKIALIYGLWNLMIEESCHNFLTFYTHITNLFNQYDLYLGMGGRICRFGMRMMF